MTRIESEIAYEVAQELRAASEALLRGALVPLTLHLEAAAAATERLREARAGRPTRPVGVRRSIAEALRARGYRVSR